MCDSSVTLPQRKLEIVCEARILLDFAGRGPLGAAPLVKSLWLCFRLGPLAVVFKSQNTEPR
jgi:hypothetical protein